jgi:hypothetical protein
MLSCDRYELGFVIHVFFRHRDVSLAAEAEDRFCSERRKKIMSVTRNFILALLAASLPGITAMGQERHIKRVDLPPAVEKTVAAEAQGATIKGFTTEKEKGQVFYEAELNVNGRTKDILISANGVIVEVEEQVAIESLSAAVKGGLQAKARDGKLLKVESLTKGGKLVAYEAVVLTGGKRSEVQVGPNGNPLDHEE